MIRIAAHFDGTAYGHGYLDLAKGTRNDLSAPLAVLHVRKVVHNILLSAPVAAVVDNDHDGEPMTNLVDGWSIIYDIFLLSLMKNKDTHAK